MEETNPKRLSKLAAFLDEEASSAQSKPTTQTAPCPNCGKAPGYERLGGFCGDCYHQAVKAKRAPAAVPGEAAAPSAARGGKTNGKANGTIDLGPLTENEKIIANAEKIVARGEKKDGTTHELIVLGADKVKMEKLEFLWQGYLPLRKPVLFAGKGDCGKSTTTRDLVARVSTGADWADGAPNLFGPQRVLMAVTEDDLNDTVVPSLVAHGANLANIGFAKVRVTPKGGDPKDREMSLSEDLQLIEAKLGGKVPVALLVLDPLFSFIRGNKNDDEVMRPILLSVAEMCKRTETAIIGIIHYNKKSDLDAVQGISGAGSTGNTWRVIWHFAPDPEIEGQYLMSKAKGNILPPTTKGLKFKIVDQEVKIAEGVTDTKGRIEWGEKHGMDANASGKPSAMRGLAKETGTRNSRRRRRCWSGN